MSDELEERLASLRKNLDAPPSNERRIDPLKVKRVQMFKTTWGTLKAAAENNPDHPVAFAYRKGGRGQKDNTEVTVDRIDIEALLDDLDIIENENEELGQDEEGDITRIIVTKKLGGKRKKVAAAPAKSPTLETHSIMNDEELARHKRESSPPVASESTLAPSDQKRPAPVKGPAKDPQDFNQIDPKSR